jgi:hypothetical protein
MAVKGLELMDGHKNDVPGTAFLCSAAGYFSNLGSQSERVPAAVNRGSREFPGATSMAAVTHGPPEEKRGSG